MKKTDARLISGAMAAEAALAKKEGESYDETLKRLPEEDPLKIAAAHQKKLVGDLGDLPPGHPVLVAMEEARLRYEAEQEAAQSEDDSEEQERQIRKAKKLDAKKAAREARNREEEENDRRRAAAKNINSSMAEAVDTLKRLNDNIIASHEDFSGDQYAMMRLERMSRVLTATMRGLTEFKLSPGRVSNGR